MFNQINIKARNTCQEADKVTSNWSIKRIMQRQPRWCFDKCMVINSCDNAWIIHSFYFGYRIRSDYETTLSIRSDMNILVPKSVRIRSDRIRIGFGSAHLYFLVTCISLNASMGRAWLQTQRGWNVGMLENFTFFKCLTNTHRRDKKD
jgi:hypothetical protein